MVKPLLTGLIRELLVVTAVIAVSQLADNEDLAVFLFLGYLIYGLVETVHILIVQKGGILKKMVAGILVFASALFFLLVDVWLLLANNIIRFSHSA